MESHQFYHLRHYVDIVSRRKWLILGCILLGISCGLAFYLKQEKVYKGEALLSYQQQKINPSQMSPDEEVGIRDIVSTLAQIVTSRSSLEQIILDENLYEELREFMPMEEVINIMRNNINIVQDMYVRSDTRRRGDTFVIEFLGTDPEKVTSVTNNLASRFIAENLQYREERAAETSLYTQSELDMAKEMLDSKEAVMRDYKLRYYNEMPEQREMNMSRLIALQEQYQGTQESIQDLERTQILLRDQINARKMLIEEEKRQSQALLAAEQGDATTIAINQRAKLEMLQSGLAELQQRYTDQHPQVKRLKRQIASQEQLIAAEDSVAEGGDAAEFDDELFALEIQLKDIGLSIKKLQQEKDEIRGLIKKYEEWVASAPTREAEWSSLTREYAELKRHYDYLVAQNLQALSALNLEVSQKGSQFKIEDPARVPETPISPNFRKIMVLATFAGLMAGALLAVGLEIVDSSFRSQYELERTFDLSVMCSVPNFALAGEKTKTRIWSLAKAVFFLTWVCVIGLTLFDVRKNEGKLIASLIQTIR